AQGETVALLALLNSAPTHSLNPHYRRGARWWIQFLRNASRLVAGFFARPMAEQWRILAWRWRTMIRRMGACLAGSGARHELDAESFVDLSSAPPEQRQLWQAHVSALSRHRTQP